MKNISVIFLVIFLIIFTILIIHSSYWQIQRYVNGSLLDDYIPKEVFGIKGDDVNILKNKSIIICACLRDNEGKVNIFLKEALKLSSYFQKYKILIVENDSSDNTREELLKYSIINPNVIILGCGVNKNKCTINLPKTEGHYITVSRINKMVYIRNIYLDYIKENYTDYDFTIVWDADIYGKVYIDGVASSINLFDKYKFIDIICANGIYRWMGFNIYYDTFAHHEYNEPCKSMRDLNIYGSSSHIRKSFMNNNLISKISNKKFPLIRVNTCFSGFSIYRTSSIQNLKYYSKDSNCEHVSLCEGCEYVYINPKMIHFLFKND